MGTFNPNDLNSKILELMEHKGLAWSKSWTMLGDGPRNAKTGLAYSGINPFILMTTPFGSSHWATWKQWASLGQTIKEGQAKAYTWIVRAGAYAKKDKETGEVTGYGRFLKTFHVYNYEQTQGEWQPPEKKVIPDVQAGLAVQKIVSANGIDVRYGGDRAYYMVGTNMVGMPMVGQFESVEAHDRVLLHEAAHWTGHKDRLDRDQSGIFGSEKYAREELVAELASVYSSVYLGIGYEPDERNAAYLQSWMKAISDDRWAFYRAAKQASQASRFLLINAGYEAEFVPVKEEDEG